MERLTGAWVAGFAASIFLLLSTAGAQVYGPPASVTSLGFGGNPGSIHGTAPSVTSLGPHGYSGGSSGGGLFGVSSGHNINGHHHPPQSGGYYPWGGGGYYAVPYYGYYDDGGYGDPPPDSAGPTVFDRNGTGPAAVSPAVDSSSSGGGLDENASAPESTPGPAQPQTVLIFKDGHQLQVENYAIVGSTLYDLTDGRKRKIALDDLDLTATSKQNEDRGVDFQLPATPTAN
jgi:hypothetical protein